MNIEFHSACVRRSAFKAIGLLSALLFVCLIAASESRGQVASVGIHTEFTDRNAPNVRVTIGPGTVVTDRTGRGNIKIPFGTYKLKIDAPCRIVEVRVGEGIEKSGPESEPTLVFRPTTTVKAIWIKMDCGAPPPVQGRLPIIFLPGVAGTELKEVGTGHQVWPLAGYGDRFKMVLDRDGVGNADRVKAGDIIRSLAGEDFYGGMVTFLTGKGYKEGSDLLVMPYDWRLDLDSPDHYNRLDAFIDQALKNTGAPKVIILAHSMGGVIARSYLISRPAGAAKVDSFISMGTPYWGSVKPYYGLVDGYDFGNPQVFNKTMKILARNFPAAHYLLPQLPFMLDTDNREISLDESFSVQYRGYVKGPGGLDDYAADDRLIWNINAPLLERARRFWARMGTVKAPAALPSGVKDYVIIGSGNRTLNGYRLETSTDDDYFAIGSRKVKGVPLWGDGDITVPLDLARMETAFRTYYIRFKQGAGGSKIGMISSRHGALAANPSVQRLVEHIIDGNAPGTEEYLKPGAYDKESVDFSLHSDAHLNITDEASGGRLGFNSGGGVDETLPTGTFVAIGESEYASHVNVSNKYKVTVNGIREGKFTLDVSITRTDGSKTPFSYKEVPVKNGTVAVVNLIPSQVPPVPVMTVTTNGKTTTVPPTLGANESPGGNGGTAPSGKDLSGLWRNPGGNAVYRFRQIGNRLHWGVDAVLLRSFANVFQGDITAGTIEGSWVDLPGSPSIGGGKLFLKVESDCKIVKTGEVNHYGADVWVRKDSICDVVGLTQRTGTTSGKPKVEEIPDKVVKKPTTPTGNTDRNKPPIVVVGDTTGVFEKPPTGKTTTGNNKPKVEEIPDAVGGKPKTNEGKDRVKTDDEPRTENKPKPPPPTGPDGCTGGSYGIVGPIQGRVGQQIFVHWTAPANHSTNEWMPFYVAGTTNLATWAYMDQPGPCGKKHFYLPAGQYDVWIYSEKDKGNTRPIFGPVRLTVTQ